MIIKNYLALIITVIILISAMVNAEETPIITTLPAATPATAPKIAIPAVASPERLGLYFAPMLASYRYEESVDGKRFMSLDGSKFGFLIGYELYNSKKNLFADFSYKSMIGRNKYNGGCSSVVNNVVIQHDAKSKNYEPDSYKQYQINIGSITGVNNNLNNIGFYSGLGYKVLNTDSRNSVYSSSVCDGSGYRRENRLIYMPIGIILGINPRFKIKGEVDLMLSGTQDSYISDTSKTTFPSTVTNKQNEGTGFNISAEYSLIYGGKNTYDAIIGTYASYWNIDASSEAMLYDSKNSSVSTIVEPENKTRELGIFLKLKF